jgi:hypothetical protein
LNPFRIRSATDSPENKQSDNDCARKAAPFSADHPELVRLVEGWANLPEPTRRAILALAEIAGGDR